MMIIWGLRVNIIRPTLYLYHQCAIFQLDTVNKNSSYSPVGP